jgi:hypothetical protein
MMAKSSSMAMPMGLVSLINSWLIGLVNTGCPVT